VRLKTYRVKDDKAAGFRQYGEPADVADKSHIPDKYMTLQPFRNSDIPTILPLGMEEIIDELKQLKNQEACLRRSYDILTNKYRGFRVKTYLNFFDIFVFDLNKIWQKNGFLHCTTMNYLLYILLVKSGLFESKDIKKHWTFVWYISPHQYLTVNLKGDRSINIDLWSKAYGVPFGSYAHGFNSTILTRLKD
jgi:hypothetical protein